MYLHDTDSTQATYYSRYLDWLEEARMDMLEVNYRSLAELNNEGISFIPSKLTISYHSPSVLGDNLIVTCKTSTFSKCSIDLDYEIRKNDKLICSAQVTMVCINLRNRPARLPEALEVLLKNDCIT